MAFENLLQEAVNGVRWLTVNRPDKLNALNRHVVADHEGAFAAAAIEPGVRAVVLAREKFTFRARLKEFEADLRRFWPKEFK